MLKSFNYLEHLSELSRSGRKLEILKQAESLLGKRGVTGFELRQIASSLEISPGLIHHYFKSTEDLIFETVIFSYANNVLDIQEKCKSELNPELVVRTWVASMMKWLESNPGIGTILEFPDQILRTGSKAPNDIQSKFSNFRTSLTGISQENVMFMASAVRALQTHSDFKRLPAIKVAALMKTDSKFAAVTSLLGFSTMGAGLWIAGRKPAQAKSTWIRLGFNPVKQTQQTIDYLIENIKN